MSTYVRPRIAVLVLHCVGFCLGLYAGAAYCTPSAPVMYVPSLTDNVSGPAATARQNARTRENVVKRFNRLPFSFEVNQGQSDAQVRFLARGPGFSLFLTPTEAVLALGMASPGGKGSVAPVQSAMPRAQTTAIVRMAFVGANRQPVLAGLDRQAGVSHYFTGNQPRQWRNAVVHYARVRYHALYPGIDMFYYGNQHQLEYDLVIAPGANPDRIHFSFEGIENMSLNRNGDLLLHTSLGNLIQHRPSVYQWINGTRRPVNGTYSVKRNEVGFQIGQYDTRQPLVIDPALTYSTYLGGSAEDIGAAIAVDDLGNAYITGYTSSLNFPVSHAVQSAFAPGTTNFGDVFVTRFTAAGNGIVYSTYLGGPEADEGLGIAVDTAGCAYVTGQAGIGFPTTPGALLARAKGGSFVTKLNPAGDTLLYSTYIRGLSTSIAIDTAGNAYITGSTSDAQFPVTAGAYQTHLGAAGATNAFITKLNASGSALVYSTLLGGNLADTASSIALDGSGDAFVTGDAGSANFPTTPGAFQMASGGSDDAFVTKLNSMGSHLVYSTLLGGSGFDSGNAIAVDSAGDAYVTGITYNFSFNTAPFPVTARAFQRTSSESADAFVTALNSAGSALLYSTFLGGTQSDQGSAIAVDSHGDAFIAGTTGSPDFPVTADALDKTCGSDGQCNFDSASATFSTDAFLAELDNSGSGLVYSTFLGGSQADRASAIALDGTGSAYLAGLTISPDFPVANAFQMHAPGGTFDAFVSKFSVTQTRLSFSAAQYQVASTASMATITVRRGVNTTGTATVSYATAGGTAHANVDFLPVQGILRWANGDATPKSFTIPLILDKAEFGTETVQLVLSHPSGAVLGRYGSATLQIFARPIRR